MLSEEIFTTELGKLYDADCIKGMKDLSENSIDMFFADPPFNLNKNYGEKVNDSLSEQDYLEWCYKWIDEAIRVLKPGGSFFLYNLPKWNFHLATYVSKQLNFRHWVTIRNTYSLPIQSRLYPAHYSLLYFVKGRKPNTFSPPRIPIETCPVCGHEIKDYGGYKSKLNPKGLSLSDVWTDIPVVRHKKYKNREANELSLKLMDRIIDISTKEGDLILDPFGGSGTTYIAAELKKRQWVGIEISTSESIIERFQNIDSDKSLLAQIELEKNTLFTEKALKLRHKHGISNGKYRVG
ncbi:MAG: site-specific DNA-methyltransferase [Candidatus Dojkabacteria bacterium]